MLNKYFLVLLITIFSCTAAMAAQTEIVCKIKGSGQKVFLLDGGFWSSKVFYRTSSGKFQEWCPETKEQNLKFGKKSAICKFSGARLRGRLAWGETTIDFANATWKKRYRHAKLGQTAKESQPGGRENAVCKRK